MPPPMRVELRRSADADAGRIADVLLASFRATYRFALAHSDPEVRAWVREVLLPSTETWVAVDEDEVIGFISLGEHAIEQLYVAPERTGNGVGSRLVQRAKDLRPRGLELWTFQVNRGARRFYERHGFVVAEETDGSGNEERQPDVRYVWR